MQVPELLKLLADENRLRLLSLLEAEELSVQEVVRITGMGQSRVSHHLGLLRAAGVVGDRREGTWTYSRMRAAGDGNPLPQALWKEIHGPFSRSDGAKADRRELEQVREARRDASRSAHDRLAGVWRLVGQDLERGSLRHEALAALAGADQTVADLGCGAGFFSAFLASRFARVIAIDHSDRMLREAEAALPGGADVELRRGDLEALPIGDGELDALFANLVLHHVADLRPAAREMARVLRPGGTAVITDLRPHKEEWMREELADLRLGIDPAEVVAALEHASFEEVREIPVEDRYRMKSRGGRSARLGLFLIRAKRARAQGARSARARERAERKE
ncbi:MAG: metalloregulator ArsR/SmtB family transcription factor [Planctomycetota bacterium]